MWPKVGNAETSGAGAVPLRSAQMMGQQKKKKSLPVCLHASLSSNHKDLPVTTTISVAVHRCTRFDPTLPVNYIFIPINL